MFIEANEAGGEGLLELWPRKHQQSQRGPASVSDSESLVIRSYSRRVHVCSCHHEPGWEVSLR